MECIEAIKNRRSIRQFTAKQISQPIIEDLICCAAMAPSAKNRQPWKFVIIRGKRKEQITKMMINQLEKNNVDEKELIYASVRQTAAIIDQASDLILTIRKKDDLWRYSDALSIGSAIENICLRAVEIGLGTLWIGDMIFIENEMMNALQLEDNELVCALAVGYPNETPKARSRKPLNEILIWM